jgi:hypothetical protein
MSARIHQRLSNVSARLRGELIRYAVVSSYLYVCFGAIILYKATILRAHHIDFPSSGSLSQRRLSSENSSLPAGRFVLANAAVTSR